MAKSYGSIKPLKISRTYEEDQKKKSYKDIKSSDYDFGVDDEYIKSFYKELSSFTTDAEKDYNSIDYGSDVTSLYDKYSSQSSSLREKAYTIRAYLNSQKSNLDSKDYDEWMDNLDSYTSLFDDTSNAFKNQKDFYTAFETKYDYDAYVLNNMGGTDGKSISARKSAYDSITARLAEIDKEMDESGYNDYNTRAYGDLEEDDKYNSLTKEKDKLKAELTKYEHGSKDTDDLYTQYSGNEDWKEDSTKRDLNIPNERDLGQYGTINIDTGEMYDIDESSVVMEDPLGAYLAFYRGEDGYDYGAVPEIGIPNPTSAKDDTRALTHVRAYNEAIQNGQDGQWEYLNNDEINLYYYMMNNGLKEEALSYLDGMKTELDRRKTEGMYKDLDDASALELVFHNVVSVPANIVGGVAAFVDDSINLAMGNEINPYDGGHTIQNYAQGVRSATAKDINKATGAASDDFLTWGDAYQGIMSGVDSAVGGLVLGGGYTVVMGMGSAASEAKELYEKGASKGQMIAGGILAGAAEAAFESISIGYFLDDVLGKPAKNVAQWFYKTLGMAGVEASEELCTTLANYVTDAAVMGSQSDWQKLIDQNKKQGLTDGQAIWQAIKQVGGEALHDAAVGAISGGAMGGVGGAVSSLQYDSAAKTYGKQIIDAGGVDTLNTLALDMAGEQQGITNFADKVALKKYGNKTAKADLTTKRGAKAVGVLADTVDSVRSKMNKSDIKSALIEKGLSKDKAENYANILVAMNEEYFNGNGHVFTLGTNEQWQKMTGDKNAYSVLSEIVTDKNSDVNIRNLAVANAKRGVRVDAEGKLNQEDVNAYHERETTKLIQAIAEANGIQGDVENDMDVSDDGKTYVNTDNGTVEVTSKEFVDGENGTLKVKVNGDQVVDTSSVSYGNVGEALVASAIVDLGVGAEDANALYKMFDGVDEKAGQAYAKGISLAFKYGRYFYTPSKLNGIVGVSKQVAKEAYRIGRKSRSNDAKAAQAKLNATAENNAKEGKKVSSKGSVVYEGAIADENGNLAAGEDSLTDVQKASVNGLKLIAELSPLNFHIFQSTKDGDTFTYVKKNGEKTHANGWYRVGTNDIYIDLNAGITGEGTVMYTAAHEISHFIKEYSPEKWDKIAEYIMNEYCSHYGGKVDALLMKHIVAIQNRSDAKTKTQQEIEDEAFEDLVCDSLSKMLIDGTVVKAMANIKQKDKGAWNTIKKAVQNLLEKWGVVIDQYKGRNPDAEEAGYFNETSKAFRKLQRMMTEAFVDAGETYSKVGNLKTEQNEVLSDRSTAEESKAIKSLGKDATVERNENGDMLVATNKDGSTVMYSERTWRMGGKEKFVATMTALGHGEQAQEYAKYLDDALGYLHELAVGYEILGQHLDADIVTDIKNGKQVLSAIVNNGEYPVNIDLALICKKRAAYMRLMAKMIEDGVFGDVKYDGDAIAEVNKILRKNGFETACLGCFVESRRLQFQTWAETIVQEWNEAVEARNKYAHYFRFADGKASLTDEEIDAIDKELSTGKKNAKGNLNLGQGSVSAKMSRLLDKVPSLARKLTVDDLLTPQGLTALRATDSNLFSLVKQRYGAASPKIVQDYNPYASEIADLTFNFVKKVTGNNVKGAQEYIKQAKKELGDAPKKLKSESKEDFTKRKAEYDAKVEALAMQKYLYSIGGARIQSFSDFMIENVFDYLQIFADLAAKELPMHGYTKEIVALRLFGMSGAKWNGSLIAHVEKSMGKEYAGLLPASEAKNGNGILVKVDGKDYCIAFDDYARNKATNGESFIQSIGMKDIVALMYDPRYSPYVGNITIGVSDKQIMAMLDSPLFRMVIPYHASGMLPQFAQLVGVDMYNDYTNYQNTTVREIRLLNDTDYTVKIGDNGKPKLVKNADGKDVGIDTHYAFNEKLQKYGDARKTCQDYLAWCRNEHPIYDGKKLIGYATFNAKFSDSPTGVDFTKHRNYYKLIEDFNTYDNITEKATPQGAVTMNFPSAENRLTAEQKSAYEKALRDTGIFSEADIKKYLEKADMTFEEIVRAEVGNRKAYNDATEPKFDSTVKEVEDYLLNAKDENGDYKFRRDSIADTAYDYIEAKNHGISLKPATGSYSADEKLSDRNTGHSEEKLYNEKNTTKEGLIRGEQRQETREAFLRRATEAVLQVGTRGKTAYGYRRTSPSDVTERSRQVEEELKLLGVPSVIYDIFEVNIDGITSSKTSEAITIRGDAVYVNNDVIIDAKQVAGHEAYHFWASSYERTVYNSVLCDNILFTSSGLDSFLSEIEDGYSLSDAEVGSKQWKKLMEETCAYTSGYIHSGNNLDRVKSFIRDFSEVETAWNALVSSQANKVLYSDRDYVTSVSKAVMTLDRIDDLIEDSGAGRRVDYANYWITSISPTDFLNMTTTTKIQDRAVFDKFPSEWNDDATMDTYDYLGELKKNGQTPYLAININTGEVMGHEGRHRLRALEREGIKSVEIVVEFKDDDYRIVKYSPDGKRLQIKDAVKIINQFGTGQTASITNVIPLNEDYRDTILANYGEATSTSDKDIRYQDRNGNSISSRALLANALESTIDSSTPAGQIELKKLKEYKEMIGTLDELSHKLTNLRNNLFTKGVTYEERKKIQEEATKTANRISVYDKKLLTLEASKPLKAVLDREKAKAVKRQKQKDAEVLKAYRDRAEAKLKKQAQHYQESRKNAVDSRRKTAMKQSIKRVVNRLNSLLNNGTKERNVKAGLQDTVASTLAAVELLFESNITNDDIVRNGIDFATEEDSIRLNRYSDLLEQRDSIIGQIDAIVKASGVSNTSGKTEALYAKIDRIDAEISKLGKELAKVFEMERARINRATVSSAIDSIENAYESIKTSEDDYIKNSYDEFVAVRLASLKESAKGTLIRDMTIAQLTELHDAVTAIAHTVSTANKLFREGKSADLGKMVATVQAQIMNRFKALKNDPRVGKGDSVDFLKGFLWNEMKPLTAFETIGSEALTELFWDVIKAESEWAKIMEEAEVFLDEQRTKLGYKSWDMESSHTFTLPDGKVFKLTLQDMMSIYAYSKREQAGEHMTEGGFQFSEHSVYKDDKGVKRIHLTGDLYATDLSTISQIISELGKVDNGNVIKYVDAVQEYLTKMGERGNKVSNVLYGIDLFKEKAYFPLMSAKDYISSVQATLNNTQTMVSLKNTGMTQQTKPHAKNPIILQGFDTVAINHIKKMADYSTQVLPIENLRRVFDSVSLADGGGSIATKAIIKKVFGASAEQYINQYITDLNGGSITDGAKSPTWALFSKFKATAVGASLSVVIQQPTAIFRAFTEISPRHFIPGKAGKSETKHLYDEIKKYAPIAIVKEMGGFDTGSNRTAQDYLGTRTDKGIKRVYDEVLDKSTWLAGKADVLGWNTIWLMVKREVNASKKYKFGSKEFYEACGERFTEVIVRTQVYDSVNSRSGYMRAKSEAVKFAMSFMGEPTTVINQAYLSILNVVRATDSSTRTKALKKLGGTIGALSVTTLLNALAKSLIYAMRDDDEDDVSLLDRWSYQFGSNLRGDVNPLTLIPYGRDIVSLFEGYDVERPDMALVADAIKSFKKLTKDGATPEEVTAFLGDVANLFGVPAKNVIRDAKAIIKLFRDIFDGVSPTDMGGAFAAGISNKDYTEKTRVENAFKKGDTAEVKRIIDKMVEEKTAAIVESGEKEADAKKQAKSRVRSSYTSTYKKLYLEAYEKKDIDEMNRIRKLLYATGLYGFLWELDETLSDWKKKD